jgi:hypothetical protein
MICQRAAQEKLLELVKNQQLSSSSSGSNK